MQAKSSKTTILDFMRSSSYAPQTAEALIETIPISGNLDHFWKDMLELEENGEISDISCSLLFLDPSDGFMS